MGSHSKVSALAARVVMTLAVLVAMYLTALDSWVRVIRRGNPEAALRMRPTDARALAQIFDKELLGNPSAIVSDEMQSSARAALNDEPLNAHALRLIGQWAAVHHAIAFSDQAMELSARVTRRDVSVQFWLIERAVQHADISDAIAHYHAALSVAPLTKSVLFPVLIAALSDNNIRAAIRPYIQQQIAWSIDMLNEAINQGNPRNVAALLMPIAGTLRAERFSFTNIMLISRLTETGDAALASDFVSKVWPETRGGLLDFGVAPTTTDQRLGALGWTFATEVGVHSLPNGEGGMDIEVDPLANNRAARRIWPLVSGQSYRFSQIIERDDGVALPSLNWAAYCLVKGKRIDVWEHRSAHSSAGRETSVINVPAGCVALEFTLTVAGPDAQSPARLRLKSLELDAI